MKKRKNIQNSDNISDNNNKDELASEAIQNTGLDSIFDIPLTIKVVLGEVVLTIEDILTFEEGSVLELDKLAGEPLDVFVKNQYVYKGEVVIINDKYGIRLTDIISPLSV